MIMKYSKQRAAILSFLETRKDHPTAEVVYENVRETFPNISLGTVYRNLTQLADHGIILRLSFGYLGSDHFDADTSYHEHFVCSACGCVQDIYMDDISYVDRAAAGRFDGVIQGHQIYFHGLCKSCAQAEPDPMSR